MDTETWQRCVEFHGHACPGLAIGYRAVKIAQEKMGTCFSKDEELVCVTENDACGVDAVQFLTGCTFGKGNLVYRDTGKQAFSFFDRRTDKRVRVIFKGRFSDEEYQDRDAIEKAILTLDADDLFAVAEPSFTPPANARIFRNVVCENCGEAAPEHKIRIHEGRKVCLDCFPDYSRGW